jgi:hypothetical protein
LAKLYRLVFGNGCGFTAEGGLYETFINNTETATSVKGTVVIASTSVQGGVDTAPKGSYVPIGIIYEDGVPKGSNVKVVTYGKAQVLLESDQTSTTGHWCGVSNDENGRMYQLAVAPVGASTHSQEIGHSLQTVGTAGSLSLVAVHFN